MRVVIILSLLFVSACTIQSRCDDPEILGGNLVCHGAFN